MSETNVNLKVKKEQVVISMTSFPQAIPYAIHAVRSLLNGTVLPDKLVLYLTFAQFGDEGLPAELLALAESNPIFEIRNYDRDIRSYRKLIPALIDFPDAAIVTVDDDVLYRPNMLSRLLEWHAKMPDAIIAHRARMIKPGKSYRRWSKYRWYHFLFKRVHCGFRILQTGVGGVLYPPHSLREDMLDPDLFTAVAPTTDDIWFWAAAVANNVPVVPIAFGQNKPKDLHKPRELSLKTKNFKGESDRNLAALKAVLKLYPEIAERIKNKRI